ncbi:MULTISPECIES: FAD-binding oxidoreductase [Streptomyces]|uniref:Putative oxidoreductase, oxygen dependent,FAD-dependent protein n=1 Tax=Streptomyces venezuelae (strain ATCC 10712 / CBS 650.69 / DSM 40230 / JCM 4526 / NBRC 13096 / PD 04745) TaxID=953739 RepID=F2RFB9_STRVP|nr:FAD-binding oxidoreductase [Streptomyces venezuelae]APE20768.1 FAD-binding protein [Streptomyces venezuelae]QER98158.1 FAD-binding oxidoreductase [Streptomyces venezuelae ATCC 10712]CCA54699.1 putative oxidoreductase, oxygen dependent,FAD-dependent protein [Streptomyces venezuelae ATCC 10712]
MGPHISESALSGLVEDLAGEVIVPGDPDYDEARRIHNAMIDRRPSVIARCATPADVSNAILFGRSCELPVAVRGGGHSVAGSSMIDGALVIDLSRMHAVVVDPEDMTVRVEGGATMGRLDHACQPFHLATTGGRVSTTGVAGFALGGGSGWLERKFGLASDNLLAADLITAEGKHVHTDTEENPDLFWALHGGGGNFGVATSLTLRLHELPRMSFVMLFFLPDKAPEVVRAYRDLTAAAPDEVGGGAIYLPAPPEPFVPPELVGKLVCGALLTYAGPVEEVRELAAPLFALKPEIAIDTDIAYTDLQCMLDDPPGLRNYWSAEYLTSFPDEAVDVFCARGAEIPMPTATQHVLFPLGGAVTAGAGPYPQPWRTAPWGVHPFATWEDPAMDEPAIQWVKDVRADARPWSIDSVYLNFTGAEGEQRVVDSFGEENYRRLAAVKAAYDPDNVFRFNHNITPTAA